MSLYACWLRGPIWFINLDPTFAKIIGILVISVGSLPQVENEYMEVFRTFILVLGLVDIAKIYFL